MCNSERQPWNYHLDPGIDTDNVRTCSFLNMILGIILWLPEGYLASRACSAALRLLKVESGINGCLPTAWVPSIYSVSPLSRLRSALEKVSVFCAWKLFARCLAASCQTQKVLGSDLPGSNRAA